jgi:DNA-binding NarL/FixJ family response regulator
MHDMKPGEQQRIIDLLIVDDHQMIRDGIKVMLDAPNKYYRFKIEEAESGEEAVQKAIYKYFDVVIIDYHLPGINGAAATEDILRYKPGIKILALSNYDEVSYADSMITAGAKGYILKNIEPAQLLNAIRTILSGKTFYSNEVAIKILEASQNNGVTIAKSKHTLTPREIEVLKLIYQEKKNAQIANELCISKRTVDTHRQNLLLKLQAKNTVGLIKSAYKLQLIK